MLGNGRAYLCLIVELHNHEDKEQQFESVWDAVQQSRDGLTDYDKVERHRIILADAERPAPMNQKGSVKRKELEELYHQDIDRC